MTRELKIFDNPRNVKRLLLAFYLSLAVLVVLDFFIHKHIEFPWEGPPAFYAVYGFVACALLIFISRLLRLCTRRGEDYYDGPGAVDGPGFGDGPRPIADDAENTEPDDE